MRKLSFLGALVGAIAFAGVASAQQVIVEGAASPREKNVGVGLVAGDGLAVTAKWWLSENTAFDARLGIGALQSGALALSGDYTYDILNIVPATDAAIRMPVYVGVGAQVGIDTTPGSTFDSSDVMLGARLPVGLSLDFQRAPVNLFAEFVPRLLLLGADNGGAAFDLGAGIGARVFF